MAAATALHELTQLQWNPTFSYTQPSHHATALFFCKPQRKSNLFRLQIFCKYKQSPCSVTDAKSDSVPAQIWKYSFDQVAIQIKKTLDSLKKPAIAAVLLGLLLLYDPNCALARSGGRIGGSAFSSRSRTSSSSSSSRKYSKPSKKNNSSSSSKTYSEPRTWVQSSSSSNREYSKPSQSSFFSSRNCSETSEAKVFYSTPSQSQSILPFHPSLSFWLPISLVGVLVFVVVLDFLSKRSQTHDGNLTEFEKTSVLKLQVGLLGSGRTIQEDFNRLAESADTSTTEGLSYVLTEATLALLRHPDYCISCYSSVDVKRSIEDGEKRFNQLSIEERGKFDEETLVNVNSIKRQSSKIRTASGFSSEYIVVTILVAAEGVHKLQPINGTTDLKEALKKLGSIPRNKIMAVEVMWTPQNEKDTLSERELLEDYPLLKPL